MKVENRDYKLEMALQNAKDIAVKNDFGLNIQYTLDDTMNT